MAINEKENITYYDSYFSEELCCYVLNPTVSIVPFFGKIGSKISNLNIGKKMTNLKIGNKVTNCSLALLLTCTVGVMPVFARKPFTLKNLEEKEVVVNIQKSKGKPHILGHSKKNSIKLSLKEEAELVRKAQMFALKRKKCLEEKSRLQNRINRGFFPEGPLTNGIEIPSSSPEVLNLNLDPKNSVPVYSALSSVINQQDEIVITNIFVIWILLGLENIRKLRIRGGQNISKRKKKILRILKKIRRYLMILFYTTLFISIVTLSLLELNRILFPKVHINLSEAIFNALQRELVFLQKENKILKKSLNEHRSAKAMVVFDKTNSNVENLDVCLPKDLGKEIVHSPAREVAIVPPPVPPAATNVLLDDLALCLAAEQLLNKEIATLPSREVTIVPPQKKNEL